jgi:sulfite reductase (NADPH) flavoprotein alpha-component
MGVEQQKESKGEARGAGEGRAERGENGSRGEGRGAAERGGAEHAQSANAGREGSKQDSRGEGRDKPGLSPEQINLALSQTWTGFNAQVGRDYSSLTLNLPKKANGEIELSFVDVVPQHERARNKATFDYKTSSIKDMEIYEDKKLNEKIMSSMLPVHRGSFFGPVYQFMAMLAALSIVLCYGLDALS